MGSSKSLKIPTFLKNSDLLLFFSSSLIGLKRQEFSNSWKSSFLVKIGSLYLKTCITDVEGDFVVPHLPWSLGDDCPWQLLHLNDIIFWIWYIHLRYLPFDNIGNALKCKNEGYCDRKNFKYKILESTRCASTV